MLVLGQLSIVSNCSTIFTSIDCSHINTALFGRN